MKYIKMLAICFILHLCMGIDLSNSTLKSPKPFPLHSIDNLIKDLYGDELPEVEEIKEDASLSPYFLRYFSMSYDMGELETKWKINNSDLTDNSTYTVFNKIDINTISVFKAKDDKYGRMFIAYGSKDKAFGVINMPTNSIKSQIWFNRWLATDFEANTQGNEADGLEKCLTTMCTIYSYHDGHTFLHHVVKSKDNDNKLLEATNGRKISLNFEYKINKQDSMIKAVSIQASIGYQDPQLSCTTYIVVCISILVLYWCIGHIFHLQNLNYSEYNSKLSFRVAFFMITTLIQFWICIIFLFFGYVYPDLKLLGFVLGFVTGGMCGFTSISTIAIMLKDRSKIRTAKYFFLHLAFSILYCILMLCVFTTIANWYLFLDSSAYVIFSNIWTVLIIFNAIFKTRCIVNLWIMLVVMLTISLSSLSNLKPNDYFQSLSLNSASNLAIFHSMCIFFIYLQSKYGSRFFLPKLLRSKIYDKFKHNIYSDFNSLKSLQCQKCTNYILEPELEYSDSNPLFKMQKYPIGTYIQTPCLHSFHPNCILKHIEDTQWCPVCNYQLAKNTYDD